MSDDLFGTRFFGHKIPAWHMKGVIVDDDTTAGAAYDLMGRYAVCLKKLFTEDGLELPHFAIMREPTHDDRQHRVFGITSLEYRLIPPDVIVSLFDQHVCQPVNTMGALRNGEIFFVSTRMLSYDVKGDEIDNYLLVFNHMNAKGSCQLKVTPVRVVCANTLSVALAGNGEVHPIIHKHDALDQLAKWMSTVWHNANETSLVFKEVFEILADAGVGSQFMVDGLLKKVYPDNPKDPDDNKPEETRLAIKHLFNGQAAGSDLPAFKGTAWGLWNTIVEYEDRFRQPGPNLAESVLIGTRAQTKKHAFRTIAAFTGMKI